MAEEDESMKKFFINLRDIALAGFFFLLPLYILFFVIDKVWNRLSSLGTEIAGVFGMNSILGVAGSTVFSILLLIFTWLVCGLLVRFSLVAAFSRAAERWLAKNIPGYDTYRSLAQDKLHQGAKVLPYTAALLKQQECWQPAYIVEHDTNGNYVVFLPSTPETTKGHLVVAKQEQIRVVPSITANQLDARLKKLGAGLLSDLALADDEPRTPDNQMLASTSSATDTQSGSLAQTPSI